MSASEARGHPFAGRSSKHTHSREINLREVTVSRYSSIPGSQPPPPTRINCYYEREGKKLECKSIAPYNFISSPPWNGLGLAYSTNLTASRRSRLDDYQAY